MLHYRFSCKNPDQYLLEVELTFESTQTETIIQIPYWRPGRYEAGNFPRLFRNFRAYADGKLTNFEKSSSHTWKVTSNPGSQCLLTYELYSADLSAGNTYFDNELLLINPVNSSVYPRCMEGDTCQIELHLPKGWRFASSFQLVEQRDDTVIFAAGNIQELLDTPILGAPDLQTLRYQSKGIPFEIHFTGAKFPEREKLLADFSAFTEFQIASFGHFPVDQYHFLFIFTPHRYHHGVEHDRSTVIVLGPASDLNKREIYDELLGVSSHELYHTWNVKALRPKDWFPYNFTGESPSRLGYVAEGITTYMGDWMLWKSGVLSDSWWLAELSIHLQKHYDNHGRYNLSLADASIDTWIDGYTRTGTPHRRVSIYSEGALLALVMDAWIMQASARAESLTTFMRKFFNTYHSSGYNESQFWKALNDTATMPWDKLRTDVVDGTGMLDSYVQEALNYFGLEIKEEPSKNILEATWGIRVQLDGEKCLVLAVLPGSPAENAGIWFHNQIILIDGKSPSAFFGESPDKIPAFAEVQFKSGFRMRNAVVKTIANYALGNITVRLKDENDGASFEEWKGISKRETNKMA